jgi:acyl carrier protein/pimeloyl-ACP methyl ester carboxylesterase
MHASEITDWMVCRIAKELGMPSEDVKTDIPLLSLGVDSMKLLSIAGELAEFTDREVSADTIWDHDSIDSLSSHLSKTDSCDQTKKKQERQIAAEVEPPLVVIVGGLNFAKQLNEFVPPNAITAWRKLDFLYHDPDVPSVAVIAEKIVKSLEKPEQHRTVTVVGYSIGGLICMEIANRLALTCREVRLTMVEPPVVWKTSDFAPQDVRRVDDSKRLRIPQISIGPILHLPQAIRRLSLRFFQELVLRPYAKCVFAICGDLPEVARKWWYFRRQIKSRVFEYRVNTYAGDALLIGRDKWMATYCHGWSEILTGGTLTFSVSGINSHRVLEQEEGIEHWGYAFQQFVGDKSSECKNETFGNLKCYIHSSNTMTRAA